MATPYTKADYQIGIICALDVEEAAMISMLDEEHPKLPKDTLDPSQYTLGRVGQHNIVIACLPAGAMGGGPAATVANNMQRSFPIKFGLMVGIGGGVWTKKNDIRLGDIVVSQPTEMHGGVVQWDYGKTESGGKFVRKGSLNKPPSVLRHAIQELQTRTRMKGLDIQSMLNMMVEKYPAMEEDYSFPGAENDQLFVAAYDHPGGDDCEKCDAKSIEPRPARKFPTPKVHYGNIASGNQVMKHGGTRDRIANEERIICFEMEAAGLMDEFPCLVIRGICDYADSHKNKKWQPYAAATAAAYARILLGYIDPQGVKDTPRPLRVLPFGRNANFVGRQSYLDRLFEIFYNNSTGDNCHRVALDGLGGVGKTQIALEFAFKLQKHAPEHSIFWVQASDIASFEKSYRDIGSKLGIPGLDKPDADVKNLVKNRLTLETTGKWLLIIDNADNSDLFYSTANQSISLLLLQYIPNSPLGGILFTTRDHKAATNFAQKVIKVGDMDLAEAKDLLRTSLQNKALMDDNYSITELLDLLVCLPLAIIQAVAYINANQTTISQYVRDYKESNESMVRLLSQGFEDERRYQGIKDPVATTWLISFNQIERYDPLAAEYMAFMSCVRAQAIPQSLLPLALGSQRTESIGTLKAYAFIQEQKEESVYDMHRLVHIAMINWLKNQEKWTMSGEKAVKRVAKAFPVPKHENRSIWMAYLPHAENVICITKGSEGVEEWQWNLLDKMGRCFWWTKQSSKSESMYRMSLKFKENTLSKEDKSILLTMGNIATALDGQGKYDAAEPIYRETLQLTEKVLGKEHPNTLLSMNNLACLLESQGRYDAAEPIYRETLQLTEKGLGKEHPNTLISMNNLAGLLESQGRYNAAEPIYRETLQLREKVLGKEHPDTLTSMNNLAGLFQSQGKYNAAEPIYRETLQLTEKVLGKEHPNTLISMNNLACLLESQGRYDAAEPIYRETLQLTEKVLGKEHPDTLISMNNLAGLLESQGKYDAAKPIYQETLQLTEKVLGKEHPDTLISMNNLAYLFQSQGKYDAAEPIYRETLQLREKVLGKEHPDTLISMNNLASLLESQGKHDDRTGSK